MTYTRPIVPDGKARRSDFYAWPYYDNLTTGSGPNELNDGDLLAPVLLNDNPKIHGLATLQTLRPILEGGLAKVPQGVGLADATDADINTVAALFAPLGISGRFGVKGTTLAGVLHRKRPHLIRLFDQYVFAAYTPGRIVADGGRSWQDYMTQLMGEIRVIWRDRWPGGPPLRPL